MEKIDINELRNKINSSRYSNAYVLIKNNIELFRVDPNESKEDIFNREILNYFKFIRTREDYLIDYQAALQNVNFFNKEVAFYLLDSGIDLDMISEPIFISTCTLQDRLMCNTENKEVLRKILSIAKDKQEIRLYNDGTKSITSTGAYLQYGAILEGNLEAFKRIKIIRESEDVESIISRYKKDGYCLLNEIESKYVHHFHNIVLDVDRYIEDESEKKSMMTMLLYSANCPFLEDKTLPIIKSILGDVLYTAYRVHLDKEIKEGKKCFVKITDYIGDFDKSERDYALMEKATSFALNVSDEDVKKYIKTKEVR